MPEPKGIERAIPNNIADPQDVRKIIEEHACAGARIFQVGHPFRNAIDAFYEGEIILRLDIFISRLPKKGKGKRNLQEGMANLRVLRHRLNQRLLDLEIPYMLEVVGRETEAPSFKSIFWKTLDLKQRKEISTLASINVHHITGFNVVIDPEMLTVTNKISITLIDQQGMWRGIVLEPATARFLIRGIQRLLKQS